MADNSKVAYQATPNATLEQQIMDSNIPKNEREWWAHKEIERLRAERDELLHMNQKYVEMILAEREACARVADAYGGGQIEVLPNVISRAIAAAIRARGESDG